MGCRLHVAKRYDIQYDTYAHFNWQCEEFHYLLDALEMDYTGEPYDESFEVSKEDWRRGIGLLHTLHLQSEGTQAEVAEALKRLSISKDEAIETLTEYLNRSDPNNSYLWLSFF